MMKRCLLAALALFSVSDIYASSVCRVDNASFYKRGFVLRDVLVSSPPRGSYRVAIEFDRPVSPVKTWGDARSARAEGNVLLVDPKPGMSALDFGLKGRSSGRARLLGCEVRGGTATPPSPTLPPPPVPTRTPIPSTPAPTAMPTPSPSPTPTRPPVSGSCDSHNSGSLLVQNFDTFPLWTPNLDDERAFKRAFCTPLYTIAGFGAEAERVPSAGSRARRDYDGRKRAGQRAGANDIVRMEIVGGREALRGKALKVTYPQGGNTSSHSGVQYPEHIPGTRARDRRSGEISSGLTPQEIYISYWVKFEDNFMWQGGGKLPGAIAERAFRDGDRSERVNARLMWRESGKLEFYIHSPFLRRYPNHPQYNDRIFWDNGRDFNGHARLTKGRWHHIEYRIKLNDVRNGRALPNGELEGWLDGRHAALYTDVTLREDPSFHFNTFFFSTFFGGSSGDGDPVWWPMRDVVAWFDQIEVSEQRIGCCHY